MVTFKHVEKIFFWVISLVMTKLWNGPLFSQFFITCSCKTYNKVYKSSVKVPKNNDSFHCVGFFFFFTQVNPTDEILKLHSVLRLVFPFIYLLSEPNIEKWHFLYLYYFKKKKQRMTKFVTFSFWDFSCSNWSWKPPRFHTAMPPAFATSGRIETIATLPFINSLATFCILVVFRHRFVALGSGSFA